MDYYILLFKHTHIKKCTNIFEQANPSYPSKTLQEKLDRTWYKTSTKHRRNFISEGTRPEIDANCTV